MKCPHNFPSSLANGRSTLAVAVVLMLVTLVPAWSWGQALKKVPFPFSPIGINVLPWLVAKEAHIAERHGIDFDPVFIGASAVLVQSMLSGAADFFRSGGPADIANVLQSGGTNHLTPHVPPRTQ